MSAALVASVLPADAVELGRVQDAWGIKGWVRIQPHSADTDALFASQDWYLQPPEARFARGFSAFKGCVAVRVAELKAHADGLVARLEGVDDRNLAESLKGCRISLPRSAFPEPEEGEYYWVDLIGLRVVNREGEDLGVVRDLVSTGPTSVLVLEYLETVDGEERAAERMIPFVAAYIDGVDRAAGRITADWQKDY
ncbi:ribosome maturation factor RimM [Hydrogenophaga borbori]|uniref:ribosome maturation factor RimM n=1 Tax=Hydrogenophaga borbori TaxID=2294117 RepID=UPI00301D3E5A